MCLLPLNTFAQTGDYTTNGYFYLPEYGSGGTDEYDEFNAYLEIADTQIEANKDGLTLRYLKTDIDTQGKVETIWGVTLANDSELHSALTIGTANGLSLDGQVLSLAISLMPYMVLDATGNQTITTSVVTINLDTESVSNVGYSIASDEITFNQDGTYLISYSISYDITDADGGTRGCVDAYVEDDHSASYVLSPGSYSRVYHREAAGGSGLSCSFIRELSATDKIRLRAIVANLNTNIDTIANRVSLTIIKVE